MDDFFNEPFFAENVDDLNRAFHNLLSPVKNIETLCEYRNRKQTELNDARPC